MIRAHRDWGGLPDDKKSGYRELGPAPLFALPVGLRIWLNEPVVFSLLPADDKLALAALNSRQYLPSGALRIGCRH